MRAADPEHIEPVVTCGHMRAQIGIRELRDTLTTTIRRVRNGETLEVTHDGVPVAILGPMPRDRLSDLLAGGDVSPPEAPADRPRRFPVTGELTASEAIEDDRSER
jgi:antitoxin (DNA-binding transcriptional repressor) of toxin-antitoxin stability system